MSGKPDPQKGIRDADILAEYARHLIVLGEDGRIAYTRTLPEGVPWIAIIAVIAPHEGALVPVFEMGWWRAHPYRSCCIRGQPLGSRNIPRRRPIRSVTSQEWKVVWPALVGFMRQELDAAIARRGGANPFVIGPSLSRRCRGIIRRPQQEEPWIAFSVDRRDAPIARAFLRENLLWRWNTFWGGFVRHALSRRLPRVTAEWVTEKRCENSVWLGALGHFLVERTPLERSYVLRAFSEGTREKALLEKLLHIHHLPTAEENANGETSVTQDAELLWWKDVLVLPLLRRVDDRLVLRSSYRHDAVRHAHGPDSVVMVLHYHPEVREEMFPETVFRGFAPAEAA